MNSDATSAMDEPSPLAAEAGNNNDDDEGGTVPPPPPPRRHLLRSCGGGGCAPLVRAAAVAFLLAAVAGGGVASLSYSRSANLLADATMASSLGFPTALISGRGSSDGNEQPKRIGGGGSLGRALEGVLRLPASSRRGGNKDNSSRKKQKKRQRNSKKDSTSGEPEQSSDYDSPTLLSLPTLGIVSLLVASLILSRTRSRPTADIVPDEREAEIMEFYERAECGTSLAIIPYLQDAPSEEEEGDDEEEGGGSFCRGRERYSSPARSRQKPKRSVSDSLLTRQNSRKSHGDVYYSRVLDTLNYGDDDNDNDDEARIQ